MDLASNESYTISSPCDFDVNEFGETHVMVNFAYGYKLYGEGKHDKAEVYYKQAVKNNPRDPITYHYLAKLYYDQTNYVAAELNFELASNYFLMKYS